MSGRCKACQKILDKVVYIDNKTKEIDPLCSRCTSLSKADYSYGYGKDYAFEGAVEGLTVPQKDNYEN